MLGLVGEAVGAELGMLGNDDGLGLAIVVSTFGALQWEDGEEVMGLAGEDVGEELGLLVNRDVLGLAVCGISKSIRSWLGSGWVRRWHSSGRTW